MVWVRGAAIRPVPAYARVGGATLEVIERELARDGDDATGPLGLAFRRFEETQPDLAERMSDALGRPLDETALALGYFLSIAIWLAFERSFGPRLERVTGDGVKATEDALALEEELRAAHGDEPLDLDDVVALEQPGVMAFVHEHVEAALEVDGRDPGGASEVDVDDVHAVYRVILVLTLSLSHAVAPAGGSPRRTELLA